jgi:Fic family protein
MKMGIQSDSYDDVQKEPYAEGSVLTVLLGDSPKVKILAAMLSEPNRDLNLSDIARLAGVARNTVYRHIDDLLSLDVVIKTREVGSSSMYQINQESDIAENLAGIEWDMVDMINGE